MKRLENQSSGDIDANYMKTAIDVQAKDNGTDTACYLSSELWWSYERTMNLKKALKKTKAALRDLETTGPKPNKESQKKSVVECLEDVEEIDTR